MRSHIEHLVKSFDSLLNACTYIFFNKYIRYSSMLKLYIYIYRFLSFVFFFLIQKLFFYQLKFIFIIGYLGESYCLINTNVSENISKIGLKALKPRLIRLWIYAFLYIYEFYVCIIKKQICFLIHLYYFTHWHTISCNIFTLSKFAWS